MSMEQRLRTLERRVLRVIQFGTVIDVDYPHKRVEVSIGERDSAWLRLSARRAAQDIEWWPPEVGEQVLIFAPNGEIASAVIGNSLYQDDFEVPEDTGTVRRVVLGDGASVRYDKESSQLNVELPGNATIVVAGNAAIEVHGSAAIEAGEEITVDAPSIKVNGGTGCITQESICHFTGTPHGDGSQTVTVGK